MTQIKPGELAFPSGSTGFTSEKGMKPLSLTSS